MDLTTSKSSARMEWESSHAYKVKGSVKPPKMIGEGWVNASKNRYRDGTRVNYHNARVCLCLEPTREGLEKASCKDMNKLWEQFL